MFPLTLHWSSLTDTVIGRPVVIACLVILAGVVRWVCARVIDRIVAHAEDSVLPEFGGRLAVSERRVQRARTIGDLLKSIVTIIVVAVFGTMILGEVGIDVAPIIAGAGILGVALGFGAQSLVKDFLSGIFMIMEDQFGVGDVVDTGEASGTVEAVSLRVTRLRDLDGTVWYVPNGQILRVGNKSQNWSRAVVDIQVGYGEDLNRVQRILREVAHDMWTDEDYQHDITEEPEVTGVEEMAPDAITLRVLVKTAPLKQWAVARELRQRIKARFDHEGIRMPFTQRLVLPSGAQAPADGADADDDGAAGTGS
jgi:moderate conductance mechanosensitive channel